MEVGVLRQTEEVKRRGWGDRGIGWIRGGAEEEMRRRWSGTLEISNLKLNKNYKLKIKNSRGFSLVEILIFSALFSMVFLGVTTAMVASLRNTKQSQRRILATYYASELKDWLKGQKEVDFAAFPKSGSYCFNTSPITAWGGTGNCGSLFTLGQGSDVVFKRYVNFTNGTSTQVNVNVTVDWNELNVVNSVPLNTVFTSWE